MNPCILDHRGSWDASRVLKNPHKGWYHHYWDNSIDVYLTESDEELLEFPGMDHLYLRFAWSYLEPEKGKFQWEMIDQMVEKWVPLGMNISFRISARETGIPYGTPKWVEEAGCPGEWFENWGINAWAPDYAHPVFLHHLEEFHQAFGERYGGKTWLEYLDVGSFGDWGEGHTSFSQKRDFDFNAMVRHLQIHRDCYPHDLVVLSDDFAHDRRDGRGDEMAAIAESLGFTWRDDSILVRYWIDAKRETASVARPDFFQRVAPRLPTILELQHYRGMKDPNECHTWQGVEGSEFGAQEFVKAMELMQASWLGYHGYAREWRGDNPNLTRTLANRCGYWFFPHSTELPSEASSDTGITLKVVMENRGIAPFTRQGAAQLVLEGPQRLVLTAENFGLSDWAPGEVVSSSLNFKVPSSAAPGIYRATLILVASRQDRPIRMAIQASREEANGGLEIGEIRLT